MKTEQSRVQLCETVCVGAHGLQCTSRGDDGSGVLLERQSSCEERSLHALGVRCCKDLGGGSRESTKARVPFVLFLSGGRVCVLCEDVIVFCWSQFVSVLCISCVHVTVYVCWRRRRRVLACVRHRLLMAAWRERAGRHHQTGSSERVVSLSSCQ